MTVLAIAVLAALLGFLYGSIPEWTFWSAMFLLSGALMAETQDMDE